MKKKCIFATQISCEFFISYDLENFFGKALSFINFGY